jgi:hypothetical protein
MGKIKKNSLYELYKTDSTVEKNGKELLFADGQIRVKLSRAGGANQKFEKILAANSKPFRRAIQAELLGNDKANELLMATYAEAVVNSWETLTEKEDGTEEYVTGIQLEGVDELQPVNKENILKVFKALPDLFKEMVDEANKITNYRTYEKEEDAKN